jgi:outer membrane protein assembly factor BamB
LTSDINPPSSLMLRCSFTYCLLVTLATGPLQAASQWSQFRGPNASGRHPQAHPPIHFGPGTNLVFKTALPPGASSPSIWDNRIFLTASEGSRLITLCLDTQDGKTLWSHHAPGERLEEFQSSESNPATATPATDGENVVSYFGSRGVFCFDLNGKVRWHHPMEPLAHVGGFGSGASPIIAGGLVLINRDAAVGSKLVALKLTTGEVAWETQRPELPSSYATPVLWDRGSEKEVVVAGSLQLRGYDLTSGEERWRVVGTPPVACTTPVVGNGMLFYGGWANGKAEARMEPFDRLAADFDKDADGFISKSEFAHHPRFGNFFPTFDMNRDDRISREDWDGVQSFLTLGENCLFAVRPGRGDLTAKIAWKQTRGLPYVPSPLFHDNRIYLVKDGGLVSCFDASTGEPIYLQERVGPTGTYYSSPVVARDHVYIASVDGKITVFQAGPKPAVVGRADLGERLVATPAIVGDSIYYRTQGHLWHFRSKG